MPGGVQRRPDAHLGQLFGFSQKPMAQRPPCWAPDCFLAGPSFSEPSLNTPLSAERAEPGCLMQVVEQQLPLRIAHMPFGQLVGGHIIRQSCIGELGHMADFLDAVVLREKAKHLGVPWRKHAISVHVVFRPFLTEQVLQPSFQRVLFDTCTTQELLVKEGKVTRHYVEAKSRNERKLSAGCGRAGQWAGLTYHPFGICWALATVKSARAAKSFIIFNLL